jgi:hypothetical protein
MAELGEGLGWMVTLFFLVPAGIGSVAVLFVALGRFLAEHREAKAAAAASPPPRPRWPEPGPL